MFHIYYITNTKNSNKYIGFTSRSIEHRWKEHIRNSKKSDYHLYRAMRKYGIKNFIIEIKSTHTSKSEALLKEKELIESLKPEYNMASGGTVPMLERKHTKESKTAMSINTSGNKNPNWKGKLFTKEVREKIRQKAKIKSQKRYTLVTPEETIIEIIGLHKFCKENNLCTTTLINNFTNPKTRQNKGKNYGWKILRIQRL